MNYVFFVSSMVSYTMAPIYQSLSHDWINFAFSFTQVILASPLISFYILYVAKTVISLASFIMEIPNIFKHILCIVKETFSIYFFVALGDFYGDTSVDLRCLVFGITLKLLAFSILLLSIVSVIAYILFCFDKTIIIIGILIYVSNTLQIIYFILPSYNCFFRTMFNLKCKENKKVASVIKSFNKIKDYFQSNNKVLFRSESEEEDSSSSSSSSSFEPISDGLDSINIIKFDEKKYNDNNIENEIDDPYIEDYVNGYDEIENKFKILFLMIFHLNAAEGYYSLFYYSNTIALDKHKKCIKIVLMHIFFVLNIAVISYDIYKLTQNYSGYFLASIIIRCIFIPLFSYYNIIIQILYKPKDSSLKAILNISSIFTIIISIIIIFCYAFTVFYKSNYRIDNLEYSPILDNISIANEKMLDHAICNYDIYSISPIDAFGYSLGGYDIKRNKAVFDNQMKTFFGENYSSHIFYKLHELDEYFLFIEYFNSLIDAHIFAFRGYNSGPEFAFQLEALAMYYIIPFFEDNVPY